MRQSHDLRLEALKLDWIPGGLYVYFSSVPISFKQWQCWKMVSLGPFKTGWGNQLESGSLLYIGINKWYVLNTPRAFAFLQGQIILMARKYIFSGCTGSLGNRSVRWGGQFHSLGSGELWGHDRIPTWPSHCQPPITVPRYSMFPVFFCCG